MMLCASRLVSTTSGVYLGHVAAHVGLFHQKSPFHLKPTQNINTSNCFRNPETGTIVDIPLNSEKLKKLVEPAQPNAMFELIDRNPRE